VPTDLTAETAVDATPASEAALKRSIAHRAMSAVLSLIVLLLAVGFVIAAIAVSSGHWKAGPVVSGSMEPTIDTGSVVLTQKVPVDDLAVGDIVMFQRPDNADEQVVHRIAELDPSQDGPLIRTKGDANATEDPWQVRPEGETAWVARGSVPYVGYAALATRTAVGQHVLLVAAGLLIGAGLVVLMWRSKSEPQKVASERDTHDATASSPQAVPAS
jgi:signal peptidase I